MTIWDSKGTFINKAVRLVSWLCLQYVAGNKDIWPHREKQPGQIDHLAWVGHSGRAAQVKHSAEMDHLGCRCTNSARVAHRARVAHLASVNHSASVDRRARVAHLDRVAHLSMVDHPANVSHQAVITDARHTCIQRCFWIWFPAHREIVKIFHTNWSKILTTTKKTQNV